jgi:hypothetical protein
MFMEKSMIMPDIGCAIRDTRVIRTNKSSSWSLYFNKGREKQGTNQYNKRIPGNKVT